MGTHLTYEGLQDVLKGGKKQTEKQAAEEVNSEWNRLKSTMSGVK